jgi:hypothetical protein
MSLTPLSSSDRVGRDGVVFAHRCVDDVGEPSFEHAECFQTAVASGLAPLTHEFRRLVPVRSGKRVALLLYRCHSPMNESELPTAR